MSVRAIKSKSEKQPFKLILKLDHQLPKSLNRKLRSHYHKNNKENKSWDIILAIECSRKKPRQPLERARIRLVRHSHRTLDYDGLVGSMKPVVDGLVSCGVLIDDSWGVTGPWDCDQKHRAKKLGPLLEIEITEIPD